MRLGSSTLRTLSQLEANLRENTDCFICSICQLLTCNVLFGEGEDLLECVGHHCLHLPQDGVGDQLLLALDHGMPPVVKRIIAFPLVKAVTKSLSTAEEWIVPQNGDTQTG